MTNKKTKLRLYRDKQRQFRWTLYASNGKALANAGEGYRRKGAMLRDACIVLNIEPVAMEAWLDTRNTALVDDAP